MAILSTAGAAPNTVFMDPSFGRATIRPMRLVTTVAGIALCLAVAGCGSDGPPTWSGPPTPLPADGNLPVDGFNEYVDSVDEPWERSSVGLATAYALPLTRGNSLDAQFETSGIDGEAIVSVTLGLLDDSVRELRLVLRFDPRTDSSFDLLDAIWLQRCHEGRGHQDWSRELCV